MSKSFAQDIAGIRVNGIEVDGQSRCGHWKSDLDVIAIRFSCCDEWFACGECHFAIAGHASEVWAKTEFNEDAVRCGACGITMQIRDYLDCAFQCPACQARFNPGCAKHYDQYFDMS